MNTHSKIILTAATLSFLSFSPVNSAAAYECKILLYGKGLRSVSFESGKMNIGLAKPIPGGVSYRARNGKWYNITHTLITRAFDGKRVGKNRNCDMSKARAAIK